MEREASHCSLVPAATNKFIGEEKIKLKKCHSIMNFIAMSVMVAFTMDSMFFCAYLEETYYA